MGILQCHTRTLRHAKQGVVGHMELDTDFIDKTLVEAAQQSTATGKPYAVAHNVGVKLGESVPGR